MIGEKTTVTHGSHDRSIVGMTSVILLLVRSVKGGPWVGSVGMTSGSAATRWEHRSTSSSLRSLLVARKVARFVVKLTPRPRRAPATRPACPSSGAQPTTGHLRPSDTDVCPKQGRGSRAERATTGVNMAVSVTNVQKAFRTTSIPGGLHDLASHTKASGVDGDLISACRGLSAGDVCGADQVRAELMGRLARGTPGLRVRRAEPKT